MVSTPLTTTNDVIVCGHPRSGNNYIRSLINLNFIGNDDYINVKFSHVPESKLNSRYKWVYIRRNIDDVMKSVLMLKNSTFSEKTTMKDFLKLRYDQSINIKKGKVKYHWGDNKVTIEDSRFGWAWLKSKKMTPKVWYYKYCHHWNSLMKKNPNMILHVSFEDLVHDFNYEMDRLSIFLIGRKLKKYENMDKKVGPLPVECSMDATKFRI